MQSRTLTFVIMTTFIFGIAMLMQAWFFKPQLPEGAEKPDDENTEKVDQDNQSSESTNENDDSNDAKKPDGSDEPKGDTKDDSENESKPKKPLQVEAPKYATLGSISEDSAEQFLVTFTSRGASIRRLELNSRFKSGKFRYRDTDVEHGYLGHLEFNEESDKGLRIQVVGDGTPAERAGLKVGDLIQQIDDTEITTHEAYQNWIESTKAKETHTLHVLRAKDSADPSNAAEHQLEVTLTKHPLSVIKPIENESDLWLNTLQLTLNSSAKQPWPELDAQMREGNWKMRTHNADGSVLTRDGRPMVEFIYTIAHETLQKNDLDGPIEIVKRFWLAGSDANSNFDRSFHVNFDFEIRNRSDKNQSLHYQLVGPTGTPIDGWWYQNKIHGRTWAIGYAAGARDLYSRNEALPFVFFGAPEIVSNEKEEKADSKFLVDPDPSLDERYRQVKFIGVDTQYFTTALIPGTDETVESFSDVEPFDAYSAFAVSNGDHPEEKKFNKTTDMTFRLFSKNIELGPKGSDNDTFQADFHLFAGPKEPVLLDEYGLDDTRSYGWFGIFARPLCALLRLFYWMTSSYSVAIIMLTVLVRSLMIPISRKAALNAQMMQYLQPEIKKIAETYKDDMQKRANAQRELFARYKYNPLGGCLLMFLQLPIFMGLYRGLSVDIALRDQPLIPGLSWCANLAAPDQLFRWDSWMPGFIADQTGWLGPYFNLLPILTIVLFLVQQKMFMPPATDDQQKMTQRMMTFMMIFMGVLFFKVPSGLCLYFVTSSIWGIVERKMIPKPKLPDNLPPLDGSKSANTTSKPEPELILRDEAQTAAKKKKDRERKKKLKDRG